MSILIKSMEMPENCVKCLCFERCYTRGIFDPLGWCHITGTELLSPNPPQDCPLVPVPPHGRLIDADALAEHKFVCTPHVTVNDVEAGVAYRLGWNTAIEAIIENAETVIGGE